jgi:galactosylceramidase
MRYHHFYALVLLTLGSAAAAETQSLRLDGTAGGKRFEGIGVVDGGGATSVLLKDYPEPQRSQILDLLYKPKFGASVSVLYVEIPGDGNSTQGAMPSHMHTRDDLNTARGYIWWIMTEARKRNPALSLDGTAWSAPGWIGDSGALLPSNRRDQGDKKFFSQDTADYYIQWLKGLRGTYGLEMDALGMRNEKGVSYATVKAMRHALDANGFGKVRLHAFDNWPDGWKFDFVKDLESDASLRDAVAIIGAHVNSDKSTVPASVREQAEKLGKPLWNTEGHVYKAGYEGLIGIVKSFNDNYVKSGITRIVNWYGIAGLYTMEPYSGEKEAALRANWPWSGHYEPNPSLWGYAHYGQFSEIGWTWLKGASGPLDAGGSYVTLKSPGKDYSVIIETAGAAGPQQLRLEIGAGLSGAALAVWRSNAKDYFVRQADLAPVDGVLTLSLEPDTVYSLTTTRGQRKGGFDAVPALSAFPFPYHEDFEGYANARQWGYLPRYFADIAGAFELAACPQRKGQCLRQAAPVPTISWAPDWQPYTILGDERWTDYEVSADVYLNPIESAGVMGRVNHVGTGYGIIPKGYYLQLAADGELKLVVVRGKVDKKALVGDAEQQALIRAGADGGAGGEKVLATTRIPGIAPHQWHRLKLQFKGAAITASVDGQPALAATDTLYANGMAGLLAGVTARQTLSTPWFDHVVIAPPGSPVPAPAVAARGQAPLYPK